MISQIRIEDFQSIEKVDLDCGPITVIHGESDTGKSAIVRALYALAFNRYPSGHVRDGAKKSYVSVVVDDAVVAAEKGDGANGYRLTSPDTDLKQVEWDKVGTDVPAEVSAVLGWRNIELDDGSRFTPNFHLQFDAPFLLTESPSRRAKLLGTLTNVATLYAAVKEANSWERRSKGRVDAQQAIMDQADAQIPMLEGVTERTKASLDEILLHGLKAEQELLEADKLRKISLLMIEAQETVALANDVIKMTEGAEAAEEFAEVERLIPKIQGLQALFGNVRNSERVLLEASEAVRAAAEEEAARLSVVEDFRIQNPVCPLCGSDERWREHDHA